MKVAIIAEKMNTTLLQNGNHYNPIKSQRKSLYQYNSEFSQHTPNYTRSTCTCITYNRKETHLFVGPDNDV